MVKFKRLLAVALVAVFALSVASCGEKKEDKTADATTTVVADTTTVAGTTVSGQTNAVTTKSTKTTKSGNIAKPTASPNEAAVEKLIARTTNARGNASQSFIKSLKGYSLSVWQAWKPDAASTKMGQTAAYVRQQVQKEFGVSIKEDGVFENYNETLSANLASGSSKLSQVCMAQDMYFASYFKNGYLSDLTTAMQTAAVDFKDPWYVQDANAFLNIDNKQYGWISFDAEYVFPYSIIYNKTLIKKQRLTDPAELAKQGKWTWDVLQMYAKKLTTSSVVGFGCSNTEVMLESMLKQQGASLVNVKRGTAPSSNLTNQTVKNTLATLAKWCNASSGFCNTFEGQSWTYPKTQFAAGKVAMIYGSHDIIKLLSASNTVDNDFGVVAFPNKTASKTYTNTCLPQFVWFIPAKFQKDAAKILFLRNEMYRQSYCYNKRNFDVLWKDYFSNDSSSVENAYNLKYGLSGNKSVFSWLVICEDENSKYKTSNVINEAISNNGAIQTAIDKYKKGLDKSYKEIWDGHKITGRLK